jgi:hypothetical protein
MSENRVLRRMYGPNMDEIIGSWRKLHDEKLHNLYPSPNTIRMFKSRRMRLTEHVACMGEKNTFRVLVGKSKGKRTLGRPRRRWENNSKMDRREIVWCGMDWINLSHDGPVEGSCEYDNEPACFIKCLEVLK